MKKCIRHTPLRGIFYSVILLLYPLGIFAQDTDFANYKSDTLIHAAKEIMETTRYCALISLDKSGHPQVRTMDPFTPDEDLVVWFGTNSSSRKVREIRNDPRVTLYYEAPNGSGYVAIQGIASLIDDPDKMGEYWKEEWNSFYPDKNSTYMLIKVIPEKLEVVDYMHGIVGASKAWTVPHVEFRSNPKE